jgi:hypothetical protein
MSAHFLLHRLGYGDLILFPQVGKPGWKSPESPLVTVSGRIDK